MLVGGFQDYILQVDKVGLYEICLVLDVFDFVLKLLGQGVDVENDDGGDSINLCLILLLKLGKYMLIVCGLGDGVSGMFILLVKCIEVLGNLVDCDGIVLLKFGSVYMMFDNDGVCCFLLMLDCLINVWLDVIFGQFDIVLCVVGGDVELIDDDGGNDINVCLEEVLLVGYYIVEVFSLSNGVGMVEVCVQVDGVSVDEVVVLVVSVVVDVVVVVVDDVVVVEVVSC